MNINYFFPVISVLSFAAFLIISVTFYIEGSGRASLRALILALTIPLPFVIFSVSGNTVIHVTGIIVTIMTIMSLILLLLPLKWRVPEYSFNRMNSKDERDTLFSRKELQPGTKLYNDYYSSRPKKEKRDDLWRNEPGLLSSNSLFYNKLAFNAAQASFDTVKLFAGFRDNGPEFPHPDITGRDMTNFIRLWGKKLGAVEVGFAEMKDYHYYTYAGRGGRYGSPILPIHKYGIIFLVEMDHEMVSSSPGSPSVMESANQYMRSAAIATQVAVMIRKSGYSAKTHFDANYDVVCPLVARDAGLGEIGRHGLLISKKYGPRVRISIVTTDFPVITDKPSADRSVLTFCSTCKKCALNCPASSIPDGPMEVVNGVLKWQLDQESCFTYWQHCGTDCGRCLSTCPYSHQHNWFHIIIRHCIRNNFIFLHLARILDDFFYGERPPAAKFSSIFN